MNSEQMTFFEITGSLKKTIFYPELFDDGNKHSFDECIKRTFRLSLSAIDDCENKKIINIYTCDMISPDVDISYVRDIVSKFDRYSKIMVGHSEFYGDKPYFRDVSMY